MEELVLDPVKLNAALEAFGQLLHATLPRRPLADYSRTILAVSDAHRELRRQLGRAWDYA